MSRWLREFRLIPIVIIAAGCLFALKSMGIILDGGYTLGQRLGGDGSLVVTRIPASRAVQLQSPSVPLAVAGGQQDGSRQSWMQDMFSYPEVTGSVAAKPAAKDAAGKEPAKDGKHSPPTAAHPPDTKPVDGTVIPVTQSRAPSGAERALLERLQERRQQLDARARELDMREGLLKEAEKKAEGQGGGEMKPNDAKAATLGQAKEDPDAARMKSVVIMYETMKPKDAAKIFDRLDIKVLMEMATKINPRRMSEILAQMSTEAAERLTVELATRTGAEKTMNPTSLPKIEGRPTN